MSTCDCKLLARLLVDKLELRTARHAVRWAIANQKTCDVMDGRTHQLWVINVADMPGHIGRWFWLLVRGIERGQPVVPVAAGFTNHQLRAYYRAGRAWEEKQHASD